MARNRKVQEPTKQQQPLTAEDKRQMRRRRARRRSVVRGIVLAVVCVVLFLVWQNWEALSPDRLISGIENLMGSGTGSYPVDLSGTDAQRLEQVGNYTVLLTDSHLVYLNRTGAEVNRFACAYPTALLRTAGRYVLVAEQGGRRVHLSTRSKVCLTMETEMDILTIDVNEKGQFVVVTDGPQGYAVQVKVYDKNGKLQYTRNRNHTATEVALSRDGAQVSLLSVETDGGNLNTVMDVFSLRTTDTEALCSYTAKDRLLYRLAYLDGGWLVAFSDSGVVMLDTADGLATVYAPTGMRVLGYAVGGRHLALAVRPYGNTGDGEIHVVKTSGETVCVEAFTGEFRHLYGGDQCYAVLTDTYVAKITADGLMGQASAEADGLQVALNGNQAIILGLNRLDAYEIVGN